MIALIRAFHAQEVDTLVRWYYVGLCITGGVIAALIGA